ncbi:cardiolipin synthase [Ferrimonas lipolytica]|uniref:Cardiolipin synthase A n=1 Tax=Ferrimonas lipolytica TaxID=2724191 RepID=A0A6H1UCN2_9GAMM|nr:cardiolipin synthase [Ferrimonas lipolytica]QIZ76113.1 cardiolipin synthase [Ferrimonas lipolytica]
MDKLYQLALWFGLSAYYLLVAAVSLRVALKRRVVGVSLAWLLVIFIVPIGGVLFYLLFGERYLGRRRKRRAQVLYQTLRESLAETTRLDPQYQDNLGAYAHPIHTLCFKQLGIPSTLGNQLELLSTPTDIFTRMCQDIEHAQSTIQLEFYIWYEGGKADHVANLLIAAAKRGVEVHLILDAAGSRDFLNGRWPIRMRYAGIHVVDALSVNPFKMFLRRLDLRQHRKILVIDNQIGYTGSMNMIDPAHFKQNEGVGQWIDVMIRINGAAATTLAAIHAWDWQVEGGDSIIKRLPENSFQPNDNRYAVQVIPSGTALPSNVIQKVLLLGIYHARANITLCAPYFVPSEHLLEALITAAARGVNVELILPDKNDSMMVSWASRSFFGELLAAGVTIYRFQGGLLHTKAVMFDNEHCLVGTVNLDMRSLQLNSEVTLAFDDPKLCNDIRLLFDQYRNHSYAHDYSIWQQRPLVSKLVEQFFYMFAPLL